MITTMSNNIEYNKRFRLFVAIFSMIILLSIILPIVTSAERAAVYDNLMSDTFEHMDGNTRESRMFEGYASKILRYVLPFMTIFGLLNMVISMASSVIYLSKQDFFDEVHILHHLRRQKMYAQGSSSKIAAWRKTMKDMGLKDSILKGWLIPDVKALALYDAREIGEDGRPSMGHFLKNSFPKHAVMLAMIIMISDKTMMNLLLKSAEVGVWFFKRAATVDYISTIERFVDSGSLYKPTYRGGKKKIFDEVYKAVLSVDQSPNTYSTEYRQRVGSEVDKWVNQTYGHIDFENNRISVDVQKSTVSVLGAGNSNEGGTSSIEVPISTFGVNPTDQTKFLVIEVSVSEARKTIGIGAARTQDPNYYSSISRGSTVLNVGKKVASNLDINQSLDGLNITHIGGVTYIAKDGTTSTQDKGITITNNGSIVIVSNVPDDVAAIRFDVSYTYNGTSTVYQATVNFDNSTLQNNTQQGVQ